MSFKVGFEVIKLSFVNDQPLNFHESLCSRRAWCWVEIWIKTSLLGHCWHLPRRYQRPSLLSLPACELVVLIQAFLTPFITRQAGCPFDLSPRWTFLSISISVFFEATTTRHLMICLLSVQCLLSYHNLMTSDAYARPALRSCGNQALRRSWWSRWYPIFKKGVNNSYLLFYN